MMNPKDRFTAEQTLNHIWIEDKAPKAQAVPLQNSLVDNLRGFRSKSKLKKAALHVIALQLNESAIKNLRDAFMQFDDNGDDLLSVKELRDGLAKAGLKDIPPDLQDHGGSGLRWQRCRRLHGVPCRHTRQEITHAGRCLLVCLPCL